MTVPVLPVIFSPRIARWTGRTSQRQRRSKDTTYILVKKRLMLLEYKASNKDKDIMFCCHLSRA